MLEDLIALMETVKTLNPEAQMKLNDFFKTYKKLESMIVMSNTPYEAYSITSFYTNYFVFHFVIAYSMMNTLVCSLFCW